MWTTKMLLIVLWVVLKVPNVPSQYDEQDLLSFNEESDNIIVSGTANNYDEFEEIWDEQKHPERLVFAGGPDDAAQEERFQKELAEKTRIWMERKTTYKITRAYPFCVDGKLPDGTDDPQLSKYAKFLNESIQPIDGATKIAQKRGQLDDSDQNSVIGEIYFQSIYSPDQEETVPPSTVRGIGRLNQWMHIVVKTVSPDVKLEGLYIQAIGGPLGLPFGQFRVDFDCTNDRESRIKEVSYDYQAVDEGFNNNEDYDYKIRDPQRVEIDPIVPCKYRPASAVRHPNVYAYNGRSGNLPPKNIFRVHFNWEDLHCTNAATMQFIILAVKSFDASTTKASVYRTQVYVQEVDSGDGIPYPYHPIWRKVMRCSGDLLDDNTEKEYRLIVDGNSKAAMLYNYEYEKCLTDKTGLIEGTRICPPGPFKCARVIDKENTLNNFKEAIEVDIKKTVVPCDIVSCRDPAVIDEPDTDVKPILGIPWKHLQQNITKHAFRISQRARGSHAASMTLAWGFALSVGAFTARYFKEIGGLTYDGGNGCLGIGFWLWAHIVIYYIAFTLMWSAIMEVSHVRSKGPYKCNDFQEYFANQTFSDTTKSQFKDICSQRDLAITIHKIFGWTSVILFHTAFVTGFVRPMNDATRTILMYLHFGTGYGGKIIAFVSVIVLAISTTTVCAEIFVEYAVGEVLMLGFFIGTHVFQRCMDKRIGVQGRKVCPVIEGIEVPDAKRPGHVINLVLMIGTFVAQLSIIVAVYITYFQTIEGSTDGVFEVFTGFMKIKNCKSPSKILSSNVSIFRYDSKPELNGVR